MLGHVIMPCRDVCHVVQCHTPDVKPVLYCTNVVAALPVRCVKQVLECTNVVAALPVNAIVERANKEVMRHHFIERIQAQY